MKNQLLGNRSRRGVASFVVAFAVVGILLVDTRPAAAVDLSGCWSGTWESCTTGHHGPLRGNFTACGENQYQVTFSGRFFKLFPFRYSVTLDVVEDKGDSVVLSGSSFLGRMFGTFTYSATASDGQFNASYSSCKDSGYFRLSKCCQ